LNLGVVGLGSRGGTLLGWVQRLAKDQNLAVTAVADLWERRRSAAAARVAGWQGRAPAECRTAGELFDRRDVDAVLIATADFQHCWHAAQAALAGKDVYVEKPFGCDFTQVARARELIRGTGRVVQFG